MPRRAARLLAANRPAASPSAARSPAARPPAGSRRAARVLAGLLGLLALPAAAQTQTQTQPQAQSPLRIGLSAPLTGPDAAYGQGLRQGAEQAVADINQRSGAGGRRFVLVPGDDAGDARQAVAVARRFTADRVRLVVGPSASSAVAAAAPVYEEAGAVVVAPGAAYAPLTGRGLWNLFRLGPSDAQQARAAGAYLARAFAGRRIGLVHDRTAFGRGLADAVAARLQEAGQPEALFEGLDRGARDLAALVGRLKAARVEGVYFGGQAPEAAALVRAMREAGLDAPMVASDAILDPAFAAAGTAGEGVVATMSPDLPRLPDPRGGRAPPRGPEAEAGAVAGFAAVEVLAQAVARAKADGGRPVAEAMRADPPLRTVLGPVGFDARGDRAGETVVLRVWRKTPDGRLDYAGGEVP